MCYIVVCCDMVPSPQGPQSRGGGMVKKKPVFGANVKSTSPCLTFDSSVLA